MKKEEKANYGGRTVYLSYISPEEYEKIENKIAGSVHCFPIKDDKVLLTNNSRGLDIIGGHVEKGETAEEAMVRECLEEGYINIRSMKLIGAIKVDNRETPESERGPYPLIGYQLFYQVDDYEILPFAGNFECTSREFVKRDDIKDRHHNWLGVHEEMIAKLSKCKPSLPDYILNKLADKAEDFDVSIKPRKNNRTI